MLGNATIHGDIGQIHRLLEGNVLELISENLSMDTPASVLIITAEMLSNVCEKVGRDNSRHLSELIDRLFNFDIPEKLENLQNHKNGNVYSKANKFITTFLETETAF